MFTPPSDRKLRGLALLLAAHVDDLQMLAASLARRMHDAYSGDSRELRGILTDVYVSLSDDMKPNTYAYASSVQRMKQAILDFRKPRYERMMAILEEELEELERNEEQFTLAWIAAVHEAFGLDAPKISGLSKRTADEIRKYGVYNGETDDRSKVHKMMRDNRIKYFAPADYTEGSDMDLLVKGILDRTAANEKLESIYYENLKESQDKTC